MIDMRSRGGYDHGLTGKKRGRIMGSTAVCWTATAHALWAISGWAGAKPLQLSSSLCLTFPPAWKGKAISIPFYKTNQKTSL